MRLRALRRTISVAALTFVLTTLTANADPGPGAWRLQNHSTGKCLVVRGTNNEAPVTHTPCAHYNDQYFRFEAIAGRKWNDFQVYRLRAVNSGKCVVARSPNYRAVQTPCTDYRDQQWVVQQSDDPSYMLIINISSNRCLIHLASDTQASVSATQCQWWRQTLPV